VTRLRVCTPLVASERPFREVGSCIFISFLFDCNNNTTLQKESQ